MYNILNYFNYFIKMKKYKTFVLYNIPLPEGYIKNSENELKLLKKLVYDPTNKIVLNQLMDKFDGLKSYQIFKDDKLMIAIVLINDYDTDIKINSKELFLLFKILYVNTAKAQKELPYDYDYVNYTDKNLIKALNLTTETFVFGYFNEIVLNDSNDAKILLALELNGIKINQAKEPFIDNLFKKINVTFNRPKVNWKEENLIWLKVQIETQEFIITEQGHLTVVDGIAYGSIQTIINWRNILPRNSWKLISDEPIPVRTTTRVVQAESIYDPEYMRNYYQVRKLDKYKMKIKIQTEANKLNMSYGAYRRQYYPNFTFRDDNKVKFSVTQNVQVQTKKIQVEDLLQAYLTIPI